MALCVVQDFGVHDPKWTMQVWAILWNVGKCFFFPTDFVYNVMGLSHYHFNFSTPMTVLSVAKKIILTKSVNVVLICRFHLVLLMVFH